VRSHLAQEPKTLDDPMVEVDELCLAQVIDVDLAHVLLLGFTPPNAGVEPPAQDDRGEQASSSRSAPTAG
jgi:hypothetical protein